MQLLKGSDLIKLNFKNPDDRSLFTSATKIVTIIVIIAEGSLYGISVYGHLLASPALIPILILQLVGSSIIVMFLDELVQKGWGLGSGISLFIMAGVAQGILWSLFSPVPAQDGPVGIFPFLIDSAIHGDLSQVFFRAGQLPSIFGLIVTSTVLLILVYVQGIHVDVPIVSTKYRGFTAVYPIKLLYTSNIPVILSSALLLMRYLWDRCFGLTTIQKTQILFLILLLNMILVALNLLQGAYCITLLPQGVWRLHCKIQLEQLYM